MCLADEDICDAAQTLAVCTEEHMSDSVLSYMLLPGLSHVISTEMVVWSQAGSKGIETLYVLFCSFVSL